MTVIDRLWPEPCSDCDLESILGGYEQGVSTRWVRVNFVASVDGSATAGGASGRLGTAADHVIFDLLRRPCDVILVAAGTVRKEGYGGELVDASTSLWRHQHGFTPHPRLAIVTGSAALDPDLPVFTQAPDPPIVLTSRSSSISRREALAESAEVILCGEDTIDLARALDELADRGLTRVHCEGGPHLFGALARQRLVDELCLTVSPMLVGGSGPRIATESEDSDENILDLCLAQVLRSDDTLLLRYTTRSEPSTMV